MRRFGYSISTMDRSEYERRRRALEELYQTDLRFLRAAHESRVRSLESLYLSLSGGADALPAQSATLLLGPEEVPQPAPEPALPPEPAPAPPPPPAPDLPADRPRNPDIRGALEEILPALPSVFNKNHILQALGWTPSRSSLYRVLSEMEREGLIEFVYLSGGRTPSQYRKV